MNWKKWPKLLEEQREILGNDYKGLLGLLKLKEHHLDWGCPITEFEEESREKVERAIHVYAKSRTWPELSEVAGAMLSERISFACGLMDDLQWCAKQLKMGPPTKDMDEAETIRWFLIDAWNQFGFDAFMNNMRDSYAGNACHPGIARAAAKRFLPSEGQLESIAQSFLSGCDA